MAAKIERAPILIADSCIGGLTVLKSLWDADAVGGAAFLADYAINPLGTRDDAEIASVADEWLLKAAQTSSTLLIACNTLSIRYHQLQHSSARRTAAERVVTMVDCFATMVEAEREALADKRVLIIGTAFTAGQDTYPDLVRRSAPGSVVSTVAATELERKIARFEEWCGVDDESITIELREALEQADVAILGCTCFPIVKDDLEVLYPDVVFLDPGAYCGGLLGTERPTGECRVSVTVTGEVVTETRVAEFASSFLGHATVDLVTEHGS